MHQPPPSYATVEPRGNESATNLAHGTGITPGQGGKHNPETDFLDEFMHDMPLLAVTDFMGEERQQPPRRFREGKKTGMQYDVSTGQCERR